MTRLPPSLAGHSSEQSLRDYAEADLSDHASMSKSMPHQLPQEQHKSMAISHYFISLILLLYLLFSIVLFICGPVPPHQLPQYRPLSSSLLSHSIFLTAVQFILVQNFHLQNTMPEMYNPKNDPVHFMMIRISLMTAIRMSYCHGYPLECITIMPSIYLILLLTPLSMLMVV